MFKHSCSRLCGLIALACCILPLSAAAETRLHSAQTLFRLSGIQTQIEQVSVAIASGFDSTSITDSQGREFPADVVAEMRAGLLSAFSAERLSAVVLSTLGSELSAVDIDAALAWYRSALGRKIKTLETESGTLDKGENRQRFLRSLRLRPPGDNRMAALRRLDEAWLVTDASVSMMIDMQVAVSAAMMHVLPQEQRTSISELVDTYEAQRGALTVHYTSETALSMLYTYEDLSTAEIDRYSEFARSETGRHYVHALNLALHKAMLEGSYELGRELGRLLHSEEQYRTL